MERDLGQIRVDSTPFIQLNQFFPGGTCRCFLPGAVLEVFLACLLCASRLVQ